MGIAEGWAAEEDGAATSAANIISCRRLGVWQCNVIEDHPNCGRLNTCSLASAKAVSEKIPASKMA